MITCIYNALNDALSVYRIQNNLETIVSTLVATEVSWNGSTVKKGKFSVLFQKVEEFSIV